jgi:RHS repeat-associated protein
VEKYSPSTSPNFYELYWYGAGNEALDETDGTGSTTDSAFHEYVMFGGRRIARRDSSGNVEYYLDDQLGSARVVTNATGGILDDIDYCPYGSECYVASAISGNNYKFTGKERDTESNLDNFGARYDAFSLARFMSPDPGNAGANPKDPQTWNAYSYVRDSPLELVDPSGMAPQATGTNCYQDGHVECENVPYHTGSLIQADSTSSPTNGANPANPEGATTYCDPNAGPCVVPGVTVIVPARKQSLWSRVKSWFSGGVLSIGALIRGTWGGPRAYRPMTRAGRNEVIRDNQDAHDGQTTCENCGQPTVPAQQSQAGVTPAQNETNVDHAYPQSRGGDGSPSNGQVLCRGCNNAKGDSVPNEPPVEDPEVVPFDIDIIP